MLLQPSSIHKHFAFHKLSSMATSLEIEHWKWCQSLQIYTKVKLKKKKEKEK